MCRSMEDVISFWSILNRLKPNDTYVSYRTANLQTLHFYIFIQQI